jgi:hypothetical protein
VSPRSYVGAACIFLFFSACNLRAASSILLASDPSAPSTLSVETYAGKVNLSTVPVQPAPAVTVVLLPEAMSPAEFENAKKNVLLLSAALQKHPLRLAVLANGSLATTGPFATRARLKSALDSIQVSADSSRKPSIAGLLDSLYAAAPQLGADWSNVLLVGTFPELDPWAAEYASALLIPLQSNTFESAGADRLVRTNRGSLCFELRVEP